MTCPKYAGKKEVVGVTLTARARIDDNVKRSFEEEAASFSSKEEMGKITIFLNDISKRKG